VRLFLKVQQQLVCPRPVAVVPVSAVHVPLHELAERPADVVVKSELEITKRFYHDARLRAASANAVQTCAATECSLSVRHEITMCWIGPANRSSLEVDFESDFCKALIAGHCVVEQPVGRTESDCE
jgi:hypothetical protein